jgi:hypothetical protein
MHLPPSPGWADFTFMMKCKLPLPLCILCSEAKSPKHTTAKKAWYPLYCTVAGSIYASTGGKSGIFLFSSFDPLCRLNVADVEQNVTNPLFCCLVCHIVTTECCRCGTECDKSALWRTNSGKQQNLRVFWKYCDN